MSRGITKTVDCDFCKERATIYDWFFNEYGTVYWEIYFCDNCGNKTKNFQRIRRPTVPELIGRARSWRDAKKIKKVWFSAFGSHPEYDDSIPLNSTALRRVNKDEKA